MDPVKAPKDQEKKDTRPLNVEEYQKKWDQMLQDTAKQIDKIRGEFFQFDICRRQKLTAIIENEQARKSNQAAQR